MGHCQVLAEILPGHSRPDILLYKKLLQLVLKSLNWWEKVKTCGAFLVHKKTNACLQINP
jgi:hypothetical protein